MELELQLFANFHVGSRTDRGPSKRAVSALDGRPISHPDFIFLKCFPVFFPDKASLKPYGWVRRYWSFEECKQVAG